MHLGLLQPIKHNAQAGEGGPLQLKNDVVTGSSVQFNGGTEVVMEAML